LIRHCGVVGVAVADGIAAENQHPTAINQPNNPIQWQINAPQ
jgi:hypothetical protein